MRYPMKNIIAGLFMLFLSGADCYATATDDELKGISWISVKEESQQPNQWLCFRKQIFIDNDIPENVYMDIAVDSKYWLWINNELVVFEGGLKRGPNPNDTYYDTVDISDYLVEGDNIISILMWYWGRDGYCHKSSGKSGLLAKISINDNNVIHTDSSWKVRIHPAFGETGNPKPNYRLPESNVSFDARKSLGNWKEYDYDDSKWEAASELGEYPCSPWNKLYKRPFPNWKDSGINYKYTADLNTIRYIYPKIKKYLSLWNIDENGIVKHRTGGWDWADWGDNIDVEILDNAWYCLALEAAINMGTLLDDKQFVDYYTSQLNLVRNASQKFFWKGNYFRSDDYKGLTDDRANGLAILAGFATKEMEEKTVKFLTADRMGASPYMEKYILEALLSGGYVQEGLDRMKQRYTNMVTSPLATLWEDWAIGGAGGGSINHGWAGGALSLLPQYVGGIYPYEAGWETIMIKPQLGDLEWVECDVPIKNSVLNVKVKNDKKKGKYEIEVFNSSKNTRIVAFPKDKIKDSELILNGKVLSSSEIQNIKEMNGEKILANTLVYKTDEKYLYFKTSDTEIRISNM